MSYRAAAIALLLSLAAPHLASAQLSPIGPPPSAGPPAPLGRVPDAIDQARQRALTPLPQAPVPAAPVRQWVPERRVFSPEVGRTVVVPGHFETRISDQQYQVPPATVYGPQGQGPVFIPGGPRPPADLRQGP